MAEPKVKVPVYNKEIYGSAMPKRGDNQYRPDGLIEFHAFLGEQLEKVPKQYRDSAKVAIESVGGYEGEHHAEIEVYYERPETSQERSTRLQEEAASANEKEQSERRALAALKKKYEK